MRPLLRSRRVGIALLLVLAASLPACADLSLRTARMRAEKLLWQARREEQALRLKGARPDSAGIARLRAAYRKVRDEIAVPATDTTSVTTQRLRVALVRVIGEAEVSGMRLAMEARRPGEALERAQWLMRFAGQDTFLRREAHFRVIEALQALGRYNEAVQQMWATLDQYPPVPPPRAEDQDPILKMPSFVVMLHQQLGDTAAVRTDLQRGIQYYERLLAQHPVPLLEAQVRTQMIQSQLALGDRSGALGTLDKLQQLVTTTPALSSGRVELLCSRGDLESLPGGNRANALAAYNEVIRAYPNTPFAPRALIGAAVLEESMGKTAEALARYKSVLDRYPSDGEHAPIALFRTAMIHDKQGDWPEAKVALETAPLRYPKTRIALEAPMAIVAHYQRSGDMTSTRAAYGKAVETYRRLIAADSTSPMNVDFRWAIARCYAGLGRWNDALATIDEMSQRDRASAVTAGAVLEAARISGQLGNGDRQRAYLKRFLSDYPNAPQARVVRAVLENEAKGSGAGGRTVSPRRSR